MPPHPHRYRTATTPRCQNSLKVSPPHTAATYLTATTSFKISPNYLLQELTTTPVLRSYSLPPHPDLPHHLLDFASLPSSTVVVSVPSSDRAVAACAMPSPPGSASPSSSRGRETWGEFMWVHLGLF